jgi:hypothetical protein
MKKLMIGFMLAVCGAGAGLAQTNFYTNVINLWYQGYKSNVLAGVVFSSNSQRRRGL